MEVTGKIKLINDTKSFGEKGFKKRELILMTNEQYPQPLLIEFVQDKCEILNNYIVGQDVKIGINLRGREWVNPQGETKYFNSVQGWKIELSEHETTEVLSPFPVLDKTYETESKNKENQNDLPF